MEDRVNLDELLGQLYGETTARLEDRLAAVERELMRRRLLSAERCTNLFSQLQDLQEEILRLMPEGEHAVDLMRTIRQGLEREHRTLRRELDEELVSRWRDVQNLRREHRELLDQRQAAADRYRLTGGYE